MGCLKNLFAMVGFVVVVAACSVAAWTYRAGIKDYYHRWRDDSVEVEDSISIGRPGQDALRSARRQSAEMERPDGPGAITLGPDEMASLIVEGISRGAADALDSISVSFDVDRVSLEAQVVTEIFARDLLGPFSSILDRRERISVSGPVGIAREGMLAWTPDRLKLRSLPLPGAAIAPMINTLTGGSDGTFLIPIPTTVGNVRVRPAGITFYRRVD